jgi:hypothetical protein
MRTFLLGGVLAILIVSPCANAAPATPYLGGLKLVTRLPAELPQRVMGFSYDGQKFWATVYLGRGQYATLDPATLEWQISNDHKRHQAIRDLSGAFGSPGANCFINGKWWIAGAYGQSFGLIDTRTWKIERMFKRFQRADKASQTYSSMAHDGTHLWIAWHWFKYKLPTSETQLLLKIDPETGNVVAEYPLPAGTRNDATHGLTWDGSTLWHAKDHRLSAIDPATGQVIAQYDLGREIKRPSGLAWDGQALWIAQFDGQIWRLPFLTN